MRRLFVILCILLIVNGLTLAQEPTSIECGDIIEDEFTEDRQPKRFTLELQAGTQIEVAGSPFGDTLEFAIGIYAPNDDLIGNNPGGTVDTEPFATTGSVSANGTYTVIAYNGRIYSNSLGGATSGTGGVGVFTIFVGCTLRDGTVIEPGDDPSSADDGTSTSDTVSAPQIVAPDFGFPGVPPVDFDNGIAIPLIFDTPNSGAINPGFDSVFGFTFEGVQDQTISLSFDRLSGNLSLGLAVISESNEIAYMSALISSSTMNSTFTLPSTSQYTIGVFQIDIASPTSPEATSFTVEVVIEE